jgi:hypothetical protein
MKYILMLFLVFPSISQAFEIEAGIGFTQFKRNVNGTWYQEAFPYELDLNSVAWSIGVSHKFNGWPRIRAEFVDLGDASAFALAVPNDHNYNPNDNSCNVKCLPLATYKSSGDVRGVALSVAPEFKISTYTGYLELGAYFFKPRYKAVVTGIIYGNAHGEYPEGMPTNYAYVKHDANVEAVYFIGAGVRHGNVDVGVRYYPVEAPNDDVPAIYRGATTLMVIFVF